MRTTLALDDALLAKDQALTGLSEKAVLVREALRALIESESAKATTDLLNCLAPAKYSLTRT